MRFPLIVLALAASMLLTGCSELVSLKPFAPAREATLDPALLGVWTDDDNDTFIVKQDGNHYFITYLDKSSSVMRFEATPFEAGNAKLLDLITKNNDAFMVPVHVPVRVWAEGNTLRFSFLDSEWLKEQALQLLTTDAPEPKGRLIVTDPSDRVRAFVMKYAADERSHTDPAVLQRIK